MSHRRFNQPPVPNPYEAAPHEAVAAAAHFVANTVQGAGNQPPHQPQPPLQEGLKFAATQNPGDSLNDRVFSPRLATAIGSRLIERTFPGIQLPAMRDGTYDQPVAPKLPVKPSVDDIRRQFLPHDRPRPTEITISPRDAWYGAGTVETEQAQQSSPVDASKDPRYLSPDARAGRKDRRDETSANAKKSREEMLNQAYDRQITELIGLFEEYGVKNFDPVEVTGRQRMIPKKGEELGHIFPSLPSGKRLRDGYLPHKARHTFGRGLRAKTPGWPKWLGNWLKNSTGVRHERRVITEVVYGIPVSRKWRPNRTNTQDYQEPVSPAKHIIFTMDGKVYRTFGDIKQGNGYSVDIESGVAFDQKDFKGKPAVGIRQKELIVDHLRHQLTLAGVPLIDARHTI